MNKSGDIMLTLVSLCMLAVVVNAFDWQDKEDFSDTTITLNSLDSSSKYLFAVDDDSVSFATSGSNDEIKFKVRYTFILSMQNWCQ